MRIFGAPFAFSVAGFACVATETSPRDVSTTPPFACFFIAGAFLGAEALAAVFFAAADIEWRGERAETDMSRRGDSRIAPTKYALFKDFRDDTSTNRATTFA